MFNNEGDKMPPKPKCTRDEIIDAAYALMEEQGVEAVVAREVGKRLGTTTGPIFTFFSGMDELKREVYLRGVKQVCDYIEGALEYVPSFKEFGLRWIRYAKEHPNVYHMVFVLYGPKYETEGLLSGDFLQALEPMKREVAETFGLDYDQATDIIEKMGVYSQGIASFITANDLDFPEEKINRDLSMMCLSLVTGWKVKRGDLDPNRMKVMLDNLDIIPRKKS